MMWFVVEGVEELTETCVNVSDGYVVCVGNSRRSCGHCGSSLQFSSVDSVEV